MSYGSMHEAMERCGLDFEVQKVRLHTAGDVEALDHKAVALVRNGRIEQVLSVVGNTFVCAQPRELLGWLDQLISEVPGAEVVGAGRNGAMIWARVQLPVERRVGPPHLGDVVKKELFVVDRFDGKGRGLYVFRTHRLSCLNGMTSVVEGAMESFTHRGDVHGKIEGIMRTLNLVNAQFDAEIAEFNEWYAAPITDGDAELAYTKVLGGYETWNEALVRRNMVGAEEATEIRNLGSVMAGYFTGAGAAPGTVWGWVNGMTKHLTHNHGRSETARPINWVGGRGRELELVTVATARSLVVGGHKCELRV